jgi:phosphatidylserine/phosphatidylglycerophosphate/cardiolipin synthase-like enzyme
MAACRRGPPDPHPLARTEQPGLFGTSQPSFDPPGPPGTSRRSFLFRIRRLAGDAACDGWRWPKGRHLGRAFAIARLQARVSKPYVLTDRTVFGALEDAGKRGVKVRIWRDARMAAELGDVDLAGASTNFEIRTSHGAELMHLKGYCVDGVTVRTGSANFSHSGERYQDNDLVILRGQTACSGFEAKFDRAWGSAK